MTKRTLSIVGCVAILAIFVVFGVWKVFDSLGPRLRILSAGTYSSMKPYGQFVTSNQGTVLEIWCANSPGPNDATIESRLFGYSFTPVGYFTLADGKRINWKWEDPREKTGDIEIDGTRYELVNGALFLVSAKDGQVRVTQLDVDLTRKLGNLAETDAKIAKFFAEASGQK